MRAFFSANVTIAQKHTAGGRAKSFKRSSILLSQTFHFGAPGVRSRPGARRPAGGETGQREAGVMARAEAPQAGAVWLDLAGERLWRGTTVLRLRRKSFAVLRYLVAHAGEVVSKDELLAAVWPGTAVSDGVWL
jgi:hypothetical protein